MKYLEYNYLLIDKNKDVQLQFYHYCNVVDWKVYIYNNITFFSISLISFNIRRQVRTKHKIHDWITIIFNRNSLVILLCFYMTDTELSIIYSKITVIFERFRKNRILYTFYTGVSQALPSFRSISIVVLRFLLIVNKDLRYYSTIGVISK